MTTPPLPAAPPDDATARCYDCLDAVAPLDTCPNCGKKVCQWCAEKPYASCCDDTETP